MLVVRIIIIIIIIIIAFFFIFMYVCHHNPDFLVNWTVLHCFSGFF